MTRHRHDLAMKLHRRAPSRLEAELALHMRAAGIPDPEREYRFAPPRRWRFDFCWPDKLLAVEAEGGVYSRGRHVRPVGFEKDAEKYNAAVVAGWRVLRFTGAMINSGEALKQIEQALKESDIQAAGTG